MKFHSQQVVDSKRADPEDHSYKMMGNMFRDRAASYDKKEYYEYLRRQAEEQNYRKKRWNFMNEQEYRYNMNQLKVIAYLFRKQSRVPMHMINTSTDQSI